MATAEKMTGVYKDIFGEDFYLEIQDHDIPHPIDVLHCRDDDLLQIE